MGKEDLLGKILTDPDDEAARLVYADWLEQRGGRGQAEFIRIQEERAAFTTWDSRQVALRVRDRALSAAGVQMALLQHLPILRGVTWVGHDGIQPAARVASFGHLLTHQDTLRRLGVGSLDVEGPRSPDDAARLGALPGLRRLALHCPRYAPEAQAWMAQSPAIESVRELVLADPVTPAGVDALLGRLADQLETVGLHASLDRPAWRALVDVELPALRRVELHASRLADDAMALAAWPSLGSAHTLALAGTGGADEALDYLWGSPNLGALRHLELSEMAPGHFPADLGTSRIHLESVTLRRVAPDPDFVAALARAGSVDALRILRQTGLPWREREVDALAGSDVPRRLQLLELASSVSMDRLLDKLAAAGPARLHTLDLTAPRSRRRLRLESILTGPSQRLLRAVALRDAFTPFPLPLTLVAQLLACPRLELLEVGIGTRPSAGREALRAHPVVQHLLETGGLTGEAFGHVQRGRAA